MQTTETRGQSLLTTRYTRLRRIGVAAAVVGAVLAACSGCGRPGPVRTVNPGNQSGKIVLWVANGSAVESTRPRILTTTYSYVMPMAAAGSAQPVVDNAWTGNILDADLPAPSRVFNSKCGWSEAVDCPVPDTAQTASVHATVVSGDREYTVAQKWVRDTTAGVLRGTWTIKTTTIEPVKQTADKKR